MTKEELRGLPDWMLASLYQYWSEETHAAGWYLQGEKMFVEALLNGTYPFESTPHTPYVVEGVVRIRELLA